MMGTLQRAGYEATPERSLRGGLNIDSSVSAQKPLPLERSVDSEILEIVGLLCIDGWQFHHPLRRGNRH